MAILDSLLSLKNKVKLDSQKVLDFTNTNRQNEDADTHGDLSF